MPQPAPAHPPHLHAPHAHPAAAPAPSLLRLAAWQRLLWAGAAIAVIWLFVAWALA